MPVIDIHAHVLFGETTERLRRDLPDHAPALERTEDGAWFTFPDGRRLGPFPAGLLDLDLRLRDMDRQGVGVQAVSVPPTHFGYRLPDDVARTWARGLNDGMIELARARPDRFQVLGTLPLQHPSAAVEEVERIATESSVRGVEIGTNVAGRDLDDPALDPVWEVLEETDLGVLLHPDQRDAAARDRLSSYYMINLIGNPLETTIALGAMILGGVLERHDRLRVGCVHGGGFAPYQLGRWDHAWRNREDVRVASERLPSETFGRVFFDSLTHDVQSLAFLGRRVGWDRVMLGSDYPFDMADEEPVASVERLELAADDASQVLERTVEAFLRSPSP